MATGFAAGYYMGTKAGRQRYDQINRALSKLRRSDALESATDRARSVLEEGVDKARSLVDTKIGHGQNGHGEDRAVEVGIIVAGPSELPGDLPFS